LSSVLYRHQRLETHFGNSDWPACSNQVSKFPVSATVYFFFIFSFVVTDATISMNIINDGYYYIFTSLIQVIFYGSLCIDGDKSQ
jgi:hypothetical protein